MSKTDNIFLIGPMGVGKTTIGQKLAKKTGKRFVDSDREIEKQTGATISLIFDIEGEAGFRERESRMIDELTAAQGIVLATGGGAVLSEENRKSLQQRGVVIYLSASPELLLKRTAYDQNRPLLQNGDRRGQINALLESREPLYRQSSDLLLTVDKLSAKQIVEKICNYMESVCAK